MSLFGSLYDENEDDEHDGASEPAAEVDAPGATPDDGTMGAPAGDEGAAPVDEGLEALPGSEPATTPVALAVETPDMSLQDFAADAFDDLHTSDAEEPGHREADVEAEPLDVTSESLPENPPAEVSGPQVAGTFAELTQPNAATVETQAGFEEERPLVEPEPDELEAPVVPAALSPTVSAHADLLPTQPPKASRSMPSLALPSFGDSGRLKTIAVAVLLAVVGFVGFRALAGGGSDDATSAGDAGIATADAPRGPAGAIGAAELVAAESELRRAVVVAQQRLAEAGSFALPVEQWDDLIPAPVRAAGEAPSEGVFLVTSDDDAACFETATRSGTTVAVGVTGDGARFTTEASGAGVCTADAATLSGWQPSLTGA